jgi:hypothetical protein
VVFSIFIISSSSVVASGDLQRNNVAGSQSGLILIASSSGTSGNTLVPSEPREVGCYHYANGSWGSTPCLSPGPSAELPKPNEGGGWGVVGVHGGGGDGREADVHLQFSQFSGESDSQYGSNDFSIQLNTNFFAGNNGHTDWVQFVEQNWPNRYGIFGGWAGLCIWQNDVTTQDYSDHTCVNTNQEGLNNNYYATVWGWVDITYGRLNTQFCDNANNCWSVVQNDHKGLIGRWTDSSGQILGMGNGSQANFNHPTSLSTQVQFWKSAVYSGFTYTDYTTGETNNLNWGTSSSNCQGSLCQETTPSTN